MASTIINPNRKQLSTKEISELALLKRIHENLVEKLGEDANISAAPFSIWLEAYRKAIRGKRSVYDEEEYQLIKQKIINKKTDELPSRLQAMILNRHLTVRSINVLDPRALEQNKDELQSQELITLLTKGSSLGTDPLQIPFRIIVPIRYIESALKDLHCSNSSTSTSKDIHLSSDVTFKLVKDYFRGIPRVIVREFIRRCAVCQSSKVVTLKDVRRQRFLHCLPESSLFERLEIDLFSLLHYDEMTQKNKTVVVVQVVDHGSKFKFAKIIPSKEADHVVAYLDDLFGIIGAPCILQSDNGSEFCNAKMIALTAKWEVQHVFSSPRHPQTNGLVERANGVIKGYIKSWQSSNLDRDWREYFPVIMHQVNSVKHQTIGISSYEYAFGVKSWKEKKLIGSILRNRTTLANKEDDGNCIDEDEFIIDGNNADNIRGKDNNIPDIQMTSAISDPNELISMPTPAVSRIFDPQEASTHYSGSQSVISNPFTPIHPPQATSLSHSHSSHQTIEQHALIDQQLSQVLVNELGIQNLRDFNSRKDAQKNSRKSVETMKKSYDKHVKPREFNVGDIVGVVLPAKLLTKLPTSYRKSNITGRICAVVNNPKNKVIKTYQVRIKDAVLSEKLHPYQLVPLLGGSETYPAEHAWDILPTDILTLPKRSLVMCVEAMLKLIKNSDRAHDVVIQEDVICFTCEEAVPILSASPCSGCKQFIHKVKEDCPKSGLRIPFKSKIFCNIYCANVNDVLPTLEVREQKEAYMEDDEQDDSVQFISHTFNQVSPQKLSKKRKFQVQVNEIHSADGGMFIKNSSESIPVNKPSSDAIDPLFNSDLIPSQSLQLITPPSQISSQELELLNLFVSQYVSKKNLRSQVRWTDNRYNDLRRAIALWNPKLNTTEFVVAIEIDKYIYNTLNHSSSANSIQSSSSNMTAMTVVPPIAKLASKGTYCIVCRGLLDDTYHWHKCARCQCRMHGYISCDVTKRSQIRVDDDIMYCSQYCFDAYR